MYQDQFKTKTVVTHTSEALSYFHMPIKQLFETFRTSNVSKIK